MSKPIIFRLGNRIYLGPVLKEDLPFITISVNDPEITQYLTIDVPMTSEAEEKWHENSANRKAGDDIILSIRLVGSNEIIGVMGLHGISFKDGTATVGCYIGRKDLWGKGYGTEAHLLLLDYVFNTLNLRKLSAEVYDFNPRSQRSLEKCGYVVESVKKEHRYRNGRFVDCHELTIFKKDFPPVWEKYKAGFFDKASKKQRKVRTKS